MMDVSMTNITEEGEKVLFLWDRILKKGRKEQEGR